MRPVKYIVLYVLCCSFLADAGAQNKNKTPAAVNTLFDDLPIDDPAKNSILQPGEDSVQKIKKNIFVTGTISSNHCFLGEPVLLTYTLYSALQSTSTIDRAPSFAGFSVNTMTADNEQVKRKKQDGKNYRVFTVQEQQLVPLQEGVLTIEPISIYNEVSYKENETTFHYGGGVDGKAIVINVYPLPVAGRPADFSGATGNFTLQAVADTVMAAGENNILHITVGGTGNFTGVSMPEITWPAGSEHFSVSSHLQISKNSFPPSGEKSFEIPFVPAKEGVLVIPAMRLPFFDTQKKTYRFVYSNPVTIHVAPALRRSAPGNTSSSEKKWAPVYYLLLAAMLVVAWLGIVFYWRKKYIALKIKKAALPVPELPVVAAIQEDINIEEELKTLWELENAGEYITAFKKLLIGCLGQCTAVFPVRSEETMLQQILVKDAGLAAAAGHLYAQCNNLLYAPGSIDTVVRTEMENRLIGISIQVNQFLVQNRKI